jgi:hypothetical protein
VTDPAPNLDSAYGKRDTEHDLRSAPLPLLGDMPESWRKLEDGINGFSYAADTIRSAAALDGERRDLKVPDLSRWRFVPHPSTDDASLSTIPTPGMVGAHIIPLRNHAFTQLCQRLRAPARYLRRIPAPLQMRCLNWGLQTDGAGSSRMLRLAQGECRAIVSEQYTALDDPLILDVLETTLGAAGLLDEVAVRMLGTGPTTALRLTLPGDARPLAGDTAEVGIDLLNGELGNRSVSVTPIAYTVVHGSSVRRTDRGVSARMRHIGDPDRLAESFRQAVPAALDASRGLRKRLEQAVDVIIADLLGEFDVLRQLGLTMAEARDVAKAAMDAHAVVLPEDMDAWAGALEAVKDVNALSVTQAIGDAAQTRSNERRLQLEEIAGRYLYRTTR